MSLIGYNPKKEDDRPPSLLFYDQLSGILILYGKGAGAVVGYQAETLIVQFCSIVQDFKRESIILDSTYAKTLPKSTKKDNFHNLIFGIDKRFIFDIINPITLTKLSLSKGGGGWRKTFKVFPIKILSPRSKIWLYISI